MKKRKGKWKLENTRKKEQLRSKIDHEEATSNGQYLDISRGENGITKYGIWFF